MRALRVLGHVAVAFAVAGAIYAAIIALVMLGLRWFGQWGPLYLCLPAMFVGLFLLLLSDRTIR